MADNRIRVWDGCLVDPFDPDPDKIRAHNFIHSSSQVNRYAGNGEYPYSIGQHSYVLAMNVPKHLARAALIHDWAECWFQDMVQPIKVRLKSYSKWEHNAMLSIGRKFGVTADEFAELRAYDKSIYIDERNAFMYRTVDTGMGDDRTGLGLASSWFIEREWRVQRTITLVTFNRLFPEHYVDGSIYIGPRAHGTS